MTLIEFKKLTKFLPKCSKIMFKHGDDDWKEISNIIISIDQDGNYMIKFVE